MRSNDDERCRQQTVRGNVTGEVMRSEQRTPPAPSCAFKGLDAAAAALLAVTTSLRLLPLAMAEPTVRRPLLAGRLGWPLPCFSFVLEASDRESSGPARALDGGI